MERKYEIMMVKCQYMLNFYTVSKAFFMQVLLYNKSELS